MTAGPLGIDLGSSLGFVDLMQEAPAWAPLSGTTLATNAQGWPLADAKINVIDDLVNQTYNGPDPAAVTPDIGGTYYLSFQGKAVLGSDYYGNFSVQDQVYNATTNTTTADLIVPHNTIAYLTIDFLDTVNRASSTGAGVANVKLIQPGYAANTTQVFTTSMLNDLAPFSSIRYLNVDGGNYAGPIYNVTYQPYSTPSFTVPAGTHTITFQGLNTVGDASAFVDTVQLVNQSGISPLITQGPGATISDPSFEAVQLPTGGFAYNSQGSAWTFASSSGLAANQSAFTNLNPNAPDGNQVAFLQNTGSISQTVSNFASGTYTINFEAMQRTNYQDLAQSFNVLVDGKVVGTFTPPVVHPASLNWSDRKLPSASSQTSGPGATGESWEDMIALANASNTDMWINIPTTATNDYITQLATLIKNGDTVNGVTYAGLNSNLKVYLEFSNEVWGGAYNNFLYEVFDAETSLYQGNTTLDNDGTTNNYLIGQRYYLEQTMNATDIFRSVLGADPTFQKVRPVLGSQENDPGYFASLLPWFESTFGAPNQYFYAIGDANYADATDFSSVDNLFASLEADLPQQAATTAAYTALANFYGLQNLAYEGGPNTSGATTAAEGQVALAAARDPRMEAYIQQLYDTFYAAGGTGAEVYDGPVGIYSPGNQFALLEQAEVSNPITSAKYRGLLDLSTASPTPVTAGSVVGTTTATPLSVTSDALAQSFSSPSAGQTNDWLLNVATAGTYDVVLQAGAGTTYGKVTVALGDKNVVGTYDVTPGATSVLTQVTLHAGLNTLAITTLSPFTATALSITPTTPYFADPGFEADHLNSGPTSYVYDPQGTPWTFTGSAGVSTNGTAFTSGNPSAPDGTQVAFLQNTGTISQVADVFVPGLYHLTFEMAQRGNFGTTQTFQVLIDGVVAGTFSPASSSYLKVATGDLTLTAGPHTIAFRGLNASGDATAFLDSVALNADGAVPLLSDPNFEADQLGIGATSYAYAPPGTPWTFTGSAGVSANNTDFTRGNPSAPAGTQVAFIQNTGTISQVANILVAGTYQLTFEMAQRANYGAAQTIQVLVDGVVVGKFNPASYSYVQESIGNLSLTAGPHTIAFRGLNTSGDATAFIDSVALNAAGNSAAAIAGAVPAPVGATPSSPAGSGSVAAVPIPLVGTDAAIAIPAATPVASPAAIRKSRRFAWLSS